MIAYGCCVGSWEKFGRFVAPNIKQRPFIAISGQKSISVAYNKILNAYAGYQGPNDLDQLEAVVLLHDDLEMIDPDIEDKIRAAIEPGVGLIGVAGGGPSLWWWNHDPIGHQMTDTRMVAFGEQRVGDVDMIEGSFMVFTPWAIRDLRFDARYEFLGYDDVCMEARNMGMRVVVADIHTHHHSTLGFKSEEVKAMWDRSELLFESKWGKPCES